MDNNNKELISNEIENLLNQWQEADRKNRSVIVIAGEERGGVHHIESFICGNGAMLIDSILNTISDKDAENTLATLMRKAMMIYKLESDCNLLENFTNFLEARLKAKKSEETKEEEGEQ